MPVLRLHNMFKQKIKDHIIEVVDLVKTYKNANKKAIDNISFYVERGSFFSFLGPNGAGKTTTISILTTTLSKTSGIIRINDVDLDQDPSNIRKQIGVIFQQPSLDVNLTAEENVRFHANLYGIFTYRPSFALMDEAYQKQVYALAEILDIEKNIFQPIKTLSGGMKRKLEIIRSLMHDPKILFLDEPTTGLDPISRQNLWDYLQKIRKEKNITIFLTTHYLEEAEGSDYLCIINEGKIEAKGSPEKIKEVLLEKFINAHTRYPQKLEQELQKIKVKFSGSNPFKIQLDNKSVHEILRKITTPLDDLKIYSPTLEQAYVQIINKNNLSD